MSERTNNSKNNPVGKIENIVFDLGRVLVKWYPEEYIEKKYGKDIAEIISMRVLNSREWLEMDRGLISEDELWDMKLRELNGLKDVLLDLKEKTLELLQPIEENVSLLPLLKRMGYRLFVLSNFSRSMFRKIRERYKFFELFDGLVISSDHFTVKPEKKIYKILIETFDVTPSVSLFIDDKLENVQAALELGFHVIHLEKPEVLREKLLEYGIIVSKMLGEGGAVL
ncbi:HAD family hydrolase [Fervidobacterium thailandense]|uniref:HAD family phosphatase n=1 Tax=Fervidobacterium thailandense TaxID=1008305 RepID=A0A1E3G120_9BACT|nr:HAD family phosphatase [Fervidobacterium thailandense]ODN29927.1 hypothetical protein A4H02_07935 [Fervidobacterium thailandense]